MVKKIVIWGGFKYEGPYYSDIILKILLNAGNFSIILILIIININGFIYKYTIDIFVKIIMTWEQSAVMLFNNLLKNKFNNVTQRLNARNLYVFKNKINSINDFSAYFVGLIEGDGWFSVSKKGKYVMYECGIEMNIRDVQLIYKIKKVLNVGVISFKKNLTSEKVVYRIRNKQHLIDIILPIFDTYPMLSNKQYDYLRFRKLLIKKIRYYKDIDQDYIRELKPINNIEQILTCDYFSSWLVGFIEAEGNFSIYTPEKGSKVISFEISQTNAYELIEAIRLYLSITANVYKDKTNNYRIKTTSVRGIENIVTFLKTNRIKLLGHKRLQFILFLKELRTLSRFDSIKIPNEY